MKKAVSHVDFLVQLDPRADGGRHFIFEMATGSRRCPIEAVRDLLASPGVIVARQGMISFVTNSDELVRKFWTDHCREDFRMAVQKGPREQMGVDSKGQSRHV